MKKPKITLGVCALLFTVCGLTLEGCRKDPGLKSDVTQVVTEKGMLSLSKSSFDQMYAQARKSGKKEAATNLERRFPKFLSMLSTKQNVVSKTAQSFAKNTTMSGKVRSSSSGKRSDVSNSSQDPAHIPDYDVVLKELVDDEAFQALLNVEGEIEVENIIYKVTPYGTFFTDANNTEALETVFSTVALNNDYTLRLEDQTTPILMESVQVQATEYNDVRLLNNSVYFVDSFIEKELPNVDVSVFPTDEAIDPIVYGDRNGSTGTPGPSTPPDNTPTYTPDRLQTNYLSTQAVVKSPQTTDPAYQNMLEYDMEFKSGIGGFLQTFFENSTRYHNFTSKYRVSALMYDRNYGIIKTIGIKVKCQKKGWFWWNKTEAQEIRAGWDYISYVAPGTVPKISLPNYDNPPSIGAYYLINPTENPLYGIPAPFIDAYAKRYNLYGFHMKRGSNEIFTIMIPGGFVPFKPDGYAIPSSKFKDAVHSGWNALKGVLQKSAPPVGPSLVNPDANNYKFPVYSLTTNEVKYLSINDMENMPKSYSSTIERQDILDGNKIATFISPYEVKAYNTDMIDIPLDFSTVEFNFSTDPSKFAVNLTQIAKSLLTPQLADGYKVKAASVFAAVRWNNEWKGIRLYVKMKG
ncbi:hypothetical protein [Pedobacter steynii]|uniref:Uncharacterized protein n=1 Tax=Pedobacter steynii TaxID=430522 RepID=A0A1D7QMI8_9SPHI|nr:hypothetical protein [Pedobacter steynii]AOM79829.1 hypothetical protein BFS30_23295 [Pedobacter steynii]